MNFSDLKIEVKRLTGRNDTAFDDRIEKAVNRAVRQWARGQPWADLKRVIDVAHPGGNRKLYLPSEVERCIWVVDKNNTQALDRANEQWDRDDTYAYVNEVQGYTDEWRPAGMSPAFTDVSGPLAVYSDNASDTELIYIAGQVLPSGGSGVLMYVEVGESLTLNGATPVTGANNLIRLDSLCKASDTNGTVRVDAQGGAIAYLGPYEREAAYPVLELLDVPNSAKTFQCGVYTRPPRLVNAYQSLPPSVSPDYVIWMAASDIHYQLGEGERSVAALRKAKDIAADECGVEKMFGDWNGQLIPETEDS